MLYILRMPKCLVAGCGRSDVVAKGLCLKHYQQQRRTGNPVAPPHPHELETRVSLRIEVEVLDRIKAKAKAMGRPVSDIIRAALRKL